jgi:hypothetical protein
MEQVIEAKEGKGVKRYSIVGLVAIAAVATLLTSRFCQPGRKGQLSPLTFQSPVYLPLVLKHWPPDPRFGVAEHGAAEMDILGLPASLHRYHSRYWKPMEASNQAVFIRPAHFSYAPSRWCVGSYAIAGRPNYCTAQGEAGIASTSGWVDIDAFNPWVLAHPGKVYIIGNELLCPEPCGSGVTAAEYAAWYADAWATIKALDPSARVAPYGPMGTQAARELAEDVWDAYITLTGGPMPADFYPIHWYPWYPGYNHQAEVAGLEAHVAWFESHRGTKWNGPKDYWLTEYGRPTWEFEIPEQELLDFMEQFTTYLMTNEVGISHWAWWPHSEAALVTNDQRAPLGQCYYNMAIGQACQ